MKVVLVQPRGSNWLPGQRDLSTVVNRMAPLGLLSLAAVLERDGHDVAIHDALGPLAPRTPEQDLEAILALEPDLVGFTTTTSSFLDAADMARRIKDRRPAAITLAGGVFPSSMGAGLLSRFDAFDHLVLGEGEETLRELAAGRPADSIAGLVRREADHCATGPPRGLAPDLNQLPFPSYGLLPGFPRGYHLPLFNTPAAPGATMVTSRGCPYQCTFCDRSVYGRGFRFQSAEYVYEHMRHLARDFRVRHINIYDDLFTFDRPRILELCNRLESRPLGVTFNCAIRTGHVDREILPLLRRAGAWMVSIGIESGDPELLARHKPGVTLEHVRATVRAVREADLKVKGLFIAGLPGETPQTLQRTVDFALSLDLDEMNLSKFSPFHGAPGWATIRDEGLFEEDWRLMNCNYFVFVPRGFASRAELQAQYARSVKAFYTSRGWRRRFRRRLWSSRHSLLIFLRHLPAMLAARGQFDADIKGGELAAANAAGDAAARGPAPPE